MKASEVRRNTIISAAARQGKYNRCEIAKSVGIPASTVYRRMEHPETMTVSELRSFAFRLKMTDQEILTVIHGKETVK